MTAKEKQTQLAKYRLKQAVESIDEAKCLFSCKKSPRSVINRLYYSMFYAVLALLVFEPFSYSKHSGVLAYFNKRFIKEGILPKELGRSINRAFDLRQEGDCRECVELSYEQVEPFMEEAANFIRKVEAYMGGEYFS